MKRPRAGATLCECLVLTLMLFGAIVIALAVGEKWGYGWSLLALPLSFFGFIGALFLIGMVADLIERGWFPRCHKGVCTGDWWTMFGDYDMVRFGEDDFGYRCKCGFEYMKKGRRFMLRRPDGTLEPYMVWKPLRGFVRDDENGPPATAPPPPSRPPSGRA